MKRDDIARCVGFLAEHPDFALQYGGQRQPLRRALERLIGNEGFRAYVFEATEEERVIFLGVGAIAFLNDAFVSNAKTSPYFWIAPALMERLIEGKSPILSDAEVRVENTLEGLSVFAWPLGFRSEHLLNPEFLTLLMGTFIEGLKGYKVKEYLGQATEVDGARASLKSGAELLTPSGRYNELPSGKEAELLSNPHLLVITRSQALKQIGSWSSSLFIYRAPVMGFSRSEQRLLEQALNGASDEYLASELEVSSSAVKKAWRSIYSKASRSLIGILPSAIDTSESGDRGKGKKHLVIAYVREHPEELRPISMKLMKRVQKPKGTVQDRNVRVFKTRRVTGSRVVGDARKE